MQLYTSLVRLKQSMNGGTLPPMTPLPEQVKDIIDPELTINGDGWGGLVEHPTKGLLCPVRGCGQHFHNLAQHLSRKHQSIGGDNGFRNVMSIPRNVGLVSESLSRKFSEHGQQVTRTGRTGLGTKQRAAQSATRKLSTNARRAQRHSMNNRNLIDFCPAQLTDRLVALQNRIGRVPILREYVAEYGEAQWRRVRDVYGTWLNCLRQCGLDARVGPTKRSTQDIVDCFAAYYAAHGELPTWREARFSMRAPIMPAEYAVRRAYDYAPWDSIMRRIATQLNVYGGRYGIPEHLKPQEESAA